MTNGNFEAKKHAYRQTQDGVVISFVVHPNDVSAAIATAPLGTRYMVGFAEIGDDEKPNSPVAQRSEPPAHNGLVAGSNPAGTTKERRPFDSLPLSQQAGIRCQDKDFLTFLEAVGLTASLEDDWDPADVVRTYCQISTRADLDKPTPNPAKAHWARLNGQYQSWVTSRQYADSTR